MSVHKGLKKSKMVAIGKMKNKCEIHFLYIAKSLDNINFMTITKNL